MFPSLAEKVKTGFWSLNRNKISLLLFYLLVIFLPTQFGRHFWPDFSFVYGLRLDYLSPTIYLTDIIIVALFLFSFQNFFKAFAKIKNKYRILYSVFLINLILGVFLSKNFPAGIYGIIKFLEFSFLAFYIFENFKKIDKSIVLGCIFISISFESFLSVFQYLNQGSIGGFFYFLGERTFSGQTPGIANASINGQLFLRPYATFSHPNVLAGFLIVSMIYILMLSKEKKISYAVIFLGTLSLFLTFSRAAIFLWMIFLIIEFVLFISEKYKKGIANLKTLSFFSLSLILLTFGYFLFSNNFILQRLISTNFSEESVVQREELAKLSLAMFEKNPVTGVGINNFYNNSINVLIQPVHNIFLLVLSETGIAGLIFLITVFANCILIAANSAKKRKYLIMLIFSVIFLGMFDHYFLTLQQGQLLFSFVIGTLFSYKKT